MSVNSEQASGSWSISENSGPANKDINLPNVMEALNLTVNNHAEPSIPSIRLPLNPAPNFRNIRDDLIMHENSDNNSVNSINNRSVKSDSFRIIRKPMRSYEYSPNSTGRISP